MNRSPILLILSLVTLNLFVLALDVFLLPQTPLFKYVSVNRATPAGGSPTRIDPRLEQNIGNLVRQQIEEAVAVQNNDIALRRLRDYYRINRTIPQIRGDSNAQGNQISAR